METILPDDDFIEGVAPDEELALEILDDPNATGEDIQAALDILDEN